MDNFIAALAVVLAVAVGAAAPASYHDLSTPTTSVASYHDLAAPASYHDL